MVFKFKFRIWLWLKDLVICCLGFLALQPNLYASSQSMQLINDAQSFFQAGHYFKAARYAFAAGEEDSQLKPISYAWITAALVRAGLYHSASYFFIRSLQTGDTAVKRKVLTYTQDLMIRVGADLFRKSLKKQNFMLIA
ncbi:MAG: hypothetical protein HY072_05185 [Deltaproteobacteria bacterium]|nr:hypothetical protein [Deltaproteobacteria bacterium]